MGGESDQENACRERALLLLSQRPHSVGELTTKLFRKGFSRRLIEQVTEDFLRVGLLDDAAFAEAFCREKIQGGRPWGSRRLMAELRKRRVESEVAATAITAVLEDAGEDAEFDLAIRAAESKWRELNRRRGVDERKKRDSLYRFLAGRGFSGEVCRRVFDTLQSG